MVKGDPPTKAAIRDERTFSELETRPTWPSLKHSLDLRTPNSPGKIASTSKKAARPNGKHVRMAFKRSAGLDVAEPPAALSQKAVFTLSKSTRCRDSPFRSLVVFDAGG
ncbi:uncharacterized protein N7511_008515 [Penicillium nucicola]|uniref:uncharacterized protein n=1 Tax=Penicillium nucicola TaxID=1850975 RepID=UPI0025458452|nr:uncharacterized protein N7511_011376 [Penicillium nucicola]XP_056981597.1 uncharacterized protein N7511_008489 [Penicillium nucicola]XP_056981611.1 uncharacterized protein N7511_008503 [Penicillium nucicola]XP_056981623.1 uncharacterized protein N7511_008515 [Penicillium nucicola]KAJ5742644.1 hypothetical protein N7511_011376 [Penicillium nucicola]KAJ5751524.1 hypothetical protein N7511_008489 [Penicillium nucicola]KAJ5751538.1 hypothetical protein N7511_008503 [Penicillium nucicola]KAJ57